MMSWKKLLETKDLIAYEKSKNDFKVRIEARSKDKGWLIYKTYNFLTGEDHITHVREYVAKSIEETRQLLTELKKEHDITLKEVAHTGKVKLELKRCYKEDYVEKWRFKIDSYNSDNFVVIRYDDEINMDIVMHDRYNYVEKDIFNKLVDALGLKGMTDKIRYDFFYFTKHSAKRRIYKKKDKEGMVAKLEFSIDPKSDPKF